YMWYAWSIDVRRGRLALCLLRQGRALEAEVEARKALRSAVNRTNTFSFDTGTLLSHLTRVLREQGRYLEAQALANETIRIYDRGGASPRSSLSVTAPHRELAATLVTQGRWQEALDEYARVRHLLADDELYRRVVADDPPFAVALLKTGRLQEASEVLGTALERSRRSRGDRHPATAELQGLRAMALAARGDTSTALTEFASATGVLVDRGAYVDDEQTSRGERDQRLAWILTSYIDLLHRVSGTAAVPRDLDPIAEAFRLAEVVRGRFVQRALDATAARSAATTPALADLARREQDALKQLGALYGLLTATSDGSDSGVVTDLRGRIDALQRARQTLVQQIEKEFPTYAQLVNPRPITLEQARAALRAGESLVTTLVTDERTYVWAVSARGRLVSAVVPLGETELREKVDRLRRALDPRARTLGAIPEFDIVTAHELYRHLLAPVWEGWEGAQSVIFVRHGVLGQIPFALLPMEPVTLGPEREPLFAAYRSVPWLVRRHAVTTLPSVGALVALRQAPAATAARRPFVGFGDPYFTAQQAEAAPREGDAPRLGMAPTASDGSGQTYRLALRDVLVSPGADVETSKLAMLPRLPDTAEEIRGIARAMSADLARDVFLGVSANEHTVKTLDLAKYRVVAFATHGLVPGDLDGLTQPALALTAPEVAHVEGDGLLTMEKILALRLDADWVVLSACNTANGAGTGAEAISGLGRAFFYAGARALLVSNWPVETTSARMLTTALFKRQVEQPTLTRARALQQTLNWMIDEGGITDPATGKQVFSFAHPIFWAPFALVGDGG
ncbi:MAG: CHAT domain-containing protein, partial [Candidatus Rokuibacteriota bacterium]